MINVAKEMEHLHKLAVENQALRFPRLWEKIITEEWITQAWTEIRQNQGSQTPGIDGRTAKDIDLDRIRQLSRQLHENTYRPKSVRRAYIPKSNGKLRPLGIPTIEDRLVQQALCMVLEPIFEADFLRSSHGFRQGHSPHTALRDVARMYPRVSWVIEGDIVGCFDNIRHDTLLQKLQTSATLRRLIRSWLKAGIMDGAVYTPTEHGTPQGGVLSPLLANIALHGLEDETKTALFDDLKASYHHTHAHRASRERILGTLSIIRYADDFVILHEDRAIVDKATEQVAQWLAPIGLELKATKTKRCHTLHTTGTQPAGFDFLGFTIRQYAVGRHARKDGSGFKTLIQPSKNAVQTHLQAIKGTLRKLRGAPQEAVIKALNPVIRGWGQYYGTCVAQRTFGTADYQMHQKLWQWATFRHPHHGLRWIKRKYFRAAWGKTWRFQTPAGMQLLHHQDHAIVRHTKVQGRRSPFDGDWLYWATRLGRHPLLAPRVARLLKRQRGKCIHCRWYFTTDSILEVHHVDHHHTNNREDNLQLVHGHCHDNIHGRSRNVRPSITEEPYDSKESRTVLKPSRDGDISA